MPKRTAAPWNRPIFATWSRHGFITMNYNGRPEERPYLRCHHCRTIVALNPDRRREREHCVACGGYVCDAKRCKVCPQAEAIVA